VVDPYYNGRLGPFIFSHKPTERHDAPMTSGDSSKTARKNMLRQERFIDYESGTVKRILAAAETVFAEKGFFGARIDDIAALADINKSMLYYHIGNKERIYEVILHRHFKKIADALENALMDCEDPIEGLRAVVDIHAAMFDSEDKTPRTVAHELAGGSRHMTQTILDEYVRIHSFTASIARRGVESGLFRDVDPSRIHIMVTGTLLVMAINAPFRNLLAKRIDQSPATMPSIDDMAEFLMDVILKYLTPNDSTS
jgi:TetR/AcrR family transcriptional regulator